MEESELEKLQKQLAACHHCEKEFGFEPRPIVWGHEKAKIMQISQAPGKKVYEIGRPFADLSGKKLREKWYQISDETFYDKDNFYITVAGHCFPGKSGKGNYDRKPPKCCFDLWTRKEIELKKDTKLYILIGQEAASRFFKGRTLKDLVFSDLKIDGVDCFVLPHPSPLNQKWLKDNPAFETEILPKLRKKIHEVLEG